MVFSDIDGINGIGAFHLGWSVMSRGEGVFTALAG